MTYSPFGEKDIVLYIPSSIHFLTDPSIETLYIVDVESCSKLCSSNLFFSKSWYVLFCAFSPKFVDIVGPSGTILFVSINGLLLFDIIFTSMFSLSENQLITLPIFEFKFGSVSFVTDPFSSSRTQSSTPVSVVFVRAILFWSGDQDILLNLGFLGKPFTWIISEFWFLRFRILTLL